MLILVLGILLSSFNVVSSDEWIFISGDKVCQYSLGESMNNSVDCDPKMDDYLNCFFNNDKCTHQDIRINYINLFQAGIFSLFGIIAIKQLRW